MRILLELAFADHEKRLGNWQEVKKYVESILLQDSTNSKALELKQELEHRYNN